MVLALPPNVTTPSQRAETAPALDAASTVRDVSGTRKQFRFAASPSKHRLPPTRAALRTRSRGIFLELATLAKLVVMLGALGVLATTFPSIGRALTATNPGPALIAATAVPPNFVLPKHLR